MGSTPTPAHVVAVSGRAPTLVGTMQMENVPMSADPRDPKWDPDPPRGDDDPPPSDDTFKDDDDFKDPKK